MGQVVRVSVRIAAGIVLAGILYLATLCFPQPLFRYSAAFGRVTVYANDPIPQEAMGRIVGTAMGRLRKSAIYRDDVRYRVFIVNNPWLWAYLSNVNRGASGLDYVGVNNIFFRHADIAANAVYGSSGRPARGDRTLEYFLAHEMTHSLEFYSMPWYRYPLRTNWVIEGYCEYVAHDSVPYETALDRYLHRPENTGEKYYTRARTMVAYLIEKRHTAVPLLWQESGRADAIQRAAIPADTPAMENVTPR